MIKSVLDEGKGGAQVAALKNEQSAPLAERARIALSEPDLTIHHEVAQTYLASMYSLEAASRGSSGSAEADEFAVPAILSRVLR